MSSIVLGLFSAFSWGAADFTGGLVSRKTGAFRAALWGETVGLLLLVPAALASGERVPETSSWLQAGLAGALGTLGLVLLYHAMARGTMSIAAPVSALMTAILPVVAGSLSEGFPGPLAFVGFGFALLAVWLVSQSEDGVKDVLAHLSSLRLPLLAGVGFGCYFILIHSAARHSTWWPMVASRAAGWMLIAIFMISRRESMRLPTGTMSIWPIIVMNGILDAGGNIFYILAGHGGRLDVSAVLGSLYPGATVLLAWLILKERLRRTQWIGIWAALAAILLLAF
ncbi:MAG: EamA family transporter [Anaerolineales bacterium]|jgi:drug/metabolite transporter (DMT)-like permease